MVGKRTGNNIKSLIEDVTVEIYKVLLSLQFIKKRGGKKCLQFKLSFCFARRHKGFVTFSHFSGN